MVFATSSPVLEFLVVRLMFRWNLMVGTAAASKETRPCVCVGTFLYKLSDPRGVGRLGRPGARMVQLQVEGNAGNAG